MSRRFKAIDNPMALPGCCLLCRKSDGPLIDSGFSEDMYGVVYICRSCVVEMANEFDFLPPEAVFEFETQIAALKSKMVDYDEVREENRVIRDAIGRIGRSSIPDSVDGVDNTKDTESDTGISGKTESKSTVVSSGTVKGRTKSSTDK